MSGDSGIRLVCLQIAAAREPDATIVELIALAALLEEQVRLGFSIRRFQTEIRRSNAAWRGLQPSPPRDGVGA